MSRQSIVPRILPIAIVAALLAVSTWVATSWPEFAW
jgi:hypothetical protein